VATKVELPCMVHNARHSTVSWTHNGQVLSVDRTIQTSDPRISIRPEDGSSTWMLEIEPSAAGDAGQYECVVTLPTGQRMTKVFNLDIVEPSSEVLWRWDSKCGGTNYLNGSLAHVTAQCDGQGTYPCCSRWGWCGFSRQHCDCHGCVDYSKKPAGSCTTPFSHSVGSSLCVTFGPAPVTYAAAEAFCEGLDASLFPYEAFAQQAEEAQAIISGGDMNVPYWVKLSVQDQLTMANLVEDFLSNLLGAADAPVPASSSSCNVVKFTQSTARTATAPCGSLHFPVCFKAAR